jgi:hypothetical protein
LKQLFLKGGREKKGVTGRRLLRPFIDNQGREGGWSNKQRKKEREKTAQKQKIISIP